MPFSIRSQRPALLLIVFCALALAVVALFAGGTSRSSAEQGQYLHFGGPGSGYLEVADNPALTPASEITIEAWVFVTSGNAWPSSGCPSIVGKGSFTSYWLGLKCGNSTQLSFYAGGDSVLSTGALPLSEWVHVAVTYDGAEVKFYINGILDSTVDLIGAIGSNTSALRIGNDTDWDRTPIGHIDEVHIWSIVRSQVSVMADMDPITTPQIGLVGVWNMEGTPDATVGGFGGSLVGDAVFSGTPLTPVPTVEPPYDKGDTDCDHQQTANDALTILNELAGLIPTLQNCTNPLLITALGVADTWWDASPGDGYIEVPHSEALNPVDAITVELWVNVWSYMSHDGLDTCNSLAGKGYTTAWWLGLCSGHLRFYPRGSGSSEDSDGMVPLREWTHVAVVADHTNVKFYINGDLDSEFTTDDAELTTNTDPMRIGSDPDYNRRPWAALDDVRIWDVALSQAAIEELIDSPPTPPQPGLIAWYALDGNAEDIANDHEGGAVGTVEYNTHLPTPYWPDINCDGLLEAADIVPILASLAGVADGFELPNGCEAIGTATY